MAQPITEARAGVSRRSFLKGGIAGGLALAAAGAAGAAGATLAQTHTASAAVPTNASDYAGAYDFPTSIDDDPYFDAPEAIEDYVEEYDVDVIVIGAGAAGVPAACAAAEEGATVAVLQKSTRVYSHGILFAGWNAPSIVANRTNGALTDEEINSLKQEFVEESGFGTQTGLLNYYFDSAPEASEWHYTTLQALGQGMRTQAGDDTLSCSYMVFNQTSIAHQAILDDYLENYENLSVHYSTPAVQLVQDETGAVTGAIAQNRDGDYLRFNAAKGVIVATGGYGGNKDLIARWLPSSIYFTNGNYPEDNTGDGAMMCIWAGADVAPLKCQKIDIRFRGDHSARTDIEKYAFLLVNDKGERMGNEDATEMLHANFVSMNPSESGSYYCIFDANYVDVLTANGDESAILDEEAIAEYEGFVEPLLWEADTLEELAEKIGVDAGTLVATCERYSELARAGVDSDYYKDAAYLYEINTPPYYAMIREYTFGGTLGAIKVDDTCNAVSRTTGEAIPGLYVVGNDMGGLQTARNYVWHDYGMTLGPAVTFGYTVGKAVANL